MNRNTTAKATPKAKSKRKAPAKKARKYTRLDALNEVLKKGGTRKDLIERSDKLYAKRGGTSSLGGSVAEYDGVMRILKYFGVVEQDGDNFKLATNRRK